MTDLAISLLLDGFPELNSAALQSLYRITGRSTVELRHAIRDGDPVITAPLFGADHIVAAPRLEKTIAFLDDQGIGFHLTETTDGIETPIDRETLRAILEPGAGIHS